VGCLDAAISRQGHVDFVGLPTHPSKTQHSQQVLLREKMNTKVTSTYQNQHTVTQEKVLFCCDSTAITATKILLINK
jgi:hypothetical protein